MKTGDGVNEALAVRELRMLGFLRQPNLLAARVEVLLVAETPICATIFK